jgi:hypothetical protein
MLVVLILSGNCRLQFPAPHRRACRRSAECATLIGYASRQEVATANFYIKKMSLYYIGLRPEGLENTAFLHYLTN